MPKAKINKTPAFPFSDAGASISLIQTPQNVIIESLAAFVTNRACGGS